MKSDPYTIYNRLLHKEQAPHFAEPVLSIQYEIKTVREGTEPSDYLIIAIPLARVAVLLRYFQIHTVLHQFSDLSACGTGFRCAYIGHTSFQSIMLLKTPLSGTSETHPFHIFLLQIRNSSDTVLLHWKHVLSLMISSSLKNSAHW